MSSPERQSIFSSIVPSSSSSSTTTSSSSSSSSSTSVPNSKSTPPQLSTSAFSKSTFSSVKSSDDNPTSNKNSSSSSSMASSSTLIYPFSQSNINSEGLYVDRLRKNSIFLNNLKKSTNKKIAESQRPKGLEGRSEEIEMMQRFPLLKEVSLEHQPILYLDKLKSCCLIFDFNDSTSEVKGKELKTEILKDVSDYLISSHQNILSIDAIYAEMFKMFSVNVFRVLPPHVNPFGDAFDAEEDDPILEPAWTHLQLIYELFVRFIDSSSFNIQLARKYVDQSFVLELLNLFDNEDPRERDYLKTCLHRVYGKFLHLRAFIRKAINNVFLEFVYETQRHYGIAELLEILGSIINGFALPLKEEHKAFLKRVLLPLHKSRSISLYFPQLSYCVNQFCQKDKSLAVMIVLQLIKMWPILNSSKQLIFLTEIEEIVDDLNQERFNAIKIPLFQLLARCIASPHFQVAERALYFWNNYSIISLMANGLADAFPIIFPVLYTYSKSHWNKTIHSLSFNALKLMMDIDPKGFEQYSSKYRKEGKRSEQRVDDEDWNRLQEMMIGASSQDTGLGLDPGNKSERNKNLSKDPYLHSPTIQIDDITTMTDTVFFGESHGTRNSKNRSQLNEESLSTLVIKDDMSLRHSYQSGGRSESSFK